MSIYEVGKKYKKIVTVEKINNGIPSVLLIDDMRYVLHMQRPTGNGGNHGRKNKKEEGSS